MWHAVEVVWNVLEVIVNWRMTLCVLASLAIAALVSWLYPELKTPIFLPAVLVGTLAGLAWEFGSMFGSRSTR